MNTTKSEERTMSTYQIEFTDTFGGDPNYSWVQRESFEAPEGATCRTLVRRGKAALNMTGRHVTCDFGDSIELRFPGECTVAFISRIEA